MPDVRRHYGDPASEYRAATEAAALFDRGHRPLLVASGRAPAQMLSGVVTGRIPGPAAPMPGGHRTTAAYSTLLTPKGRIVSDLTLIRAPGPAERFWMDVPAAGLDDLRAHLAKVLPPRMARVEPGDGFERLAIVGPLADQALTTALGVEGAGEVLSSAGEEDAFVFSLGGTGAPAPSRGSESAPLGDAAEAQAAPDDEAVTLFRPPDLGATGWEAFGPAASMERLRGRLLDLEVARAGSGVWETLRVERGRPRLGVDMTESTIPIEAGIDERAIDYQKGCYTGQEVIIRIRHRGHVNRHLRHLHLGEVPSPAHGTELFAEGDARPVGWLTSAVASPAFAETLALGYVRREVAPGERVRVGAPDGPEARVAALP